MLEKSAYYEIAEMSKAKDGAEPLRSDSAHGGARPHKMTAPHSSRAVCSPTEACPLVPSKQTESHSAVLCGFINPSSLNPMIRHAPWIG